MTDSIWYIQAVADPSTARGYMPAGYNGVGRDVVFAALRSLAYRAEIGEGVDATEFPTRYEAVNTDPSRTLNLPLWHSTLRHVRNDMAMVLRRFDLGNTVLAPIQITLPDGAGLSMDYAVLSVPNLKATIDPSGSVPIKRGRKRWGPLHCAGPVDTSVVALRSALDGPDIWTAPEVSTTIFISEHLARALLAEDWGKQLKLRRVHVAD